MDFQITIKPPPENPSRTEYRKPFTYYFDEDNFCYAMIHDYFKEFMKKVETINPRGVE